MSTLFVNMTEDIQHLQVGGAFMRLPAHSSQEAPMGALEWVLSGPMGSCAGCGAPLTQEGEGCFCAQLPKNPREVDIEVIPGKFRDLLLILRDPEGTLRVRHYIP